MVVVTSGRGSEGSGKFISSQLGMSITRRKEAFVICTGLMAMCVCVCVESGALWELNEWRGGENELQDNDSL